MADNGYPPLWAIILAAAAATYLTRIGGHLLIKRMKRIPPRLDQALNAVPAAVLTTLVTPAFFTGGWDTRLALVAAFAVSLKRPGLWMLGAAWLVAMAWRHLGPG